MNWFKNLVCKWVREDWDNANRANQPSPELVCSSDDEIDMDSGFRFTVMPARGGTIVQLRGYNRKHDRRSYSTHVIPEGEDIASSIGYIVSMELLQGSPDDR